MCEASDRFSLLAALLWCWRACGRDPKSSWRIKPFTSVTWAKVSIARCVWIMKIQHSYLVSDFLCALWALEPLLHPQQSREVLPAQPCVWVLTKLTAVLPSAMLEVTCVIMYISFECTSQDNTARRTLLDKYAYSIIKLGLFSWK